MCIRDRIDTILTNNNTDPTSTVTISGSPTVQYVSYAGNDGGAIITMGSSQSASFNASPSDAGTLVKINTGTSTAVTITVNDTILAGMSIGAQIMFVWDAGTGGSILFNNTGGATFSSANDMKNFRTKGSFTTLIKSSATAFYIIGDLAPY